ncbi:urease accessory protein UreH [Candidatus Woesearchaeota archaeon CG10_big_fil_rev_8_21_14_0_10_32_24]|nr:MAG: urease accessory protein UreH [Candidatus Woesearchaeota archaeon CG10_big_fil_rev_8_21_14_0_10_32_24]
MIQTLLLGFVLGIEHAIEPDHLAAINTQGILKHGLFWGLGHALMLFLFGGLFFILNKIIPVIWSYGLEFLVGVMLVVIGVMSFYAIKKKSFIIGMIHGLAGSAALVLLASSIGFIFVFGVGSIFGMVLITGILSVPLRKLTKYQKHFRITTGIISIGIGLIIIVQNAYILYMIMI